jgi:hypothetical protein
MRDNAWTRLITKLGDLINKINYEIYLLHLLLKIIIKMIAIFCILKILIIHKVESLRNKILKFIEMTKLQQ